MKENRIITFLSALKWNLVFWIKYIVDKDFNYCIKRNKKELPAQTVNKCFIIGNGPSINKVDFTLIENEVKFSVNSIMNNRELYEKINPDFHVIADPAYFNDKLPNYHVLLHHLKNKKTCKKRPLVITSYEGKKTIVKYGINKLNDIFYVFSHGNLNSGLNKISMSRNMPVAQNVVQMAIYAAISMGFRDIYLLGCEMTSFIPNLHQISVSINENESYHAYNYTEEIKRQMEGLKQTYDNSFVFFDYAKTFQIFKDIEMYSRKHKIKIYNATNTGVLDVFQTVNLNLDI